MLDLKKKKVAMGSLKVARFQDNGRQISNIVPWLFMF